MKKVLFVCLGNICRSPTADGVFRALVKEHKLQDSIIVDSAGTAAYHVGNSPDSRSSLAAKDRGYDLSTLKARQVVEADFYEFDYILAMDNQNLCNLVRMQPENSKASLQLFLDFSHLPECEVPDPYYGEGKGFEVVLDLVESASQGLLRHMMKAV